MGSGFIKPHFLDLGASWKQVGKSSQVKREFERERDGGLDIIVEEYIVT
jgi:hypothetical protein